VTTISVTTTTDEVNRIIRAMAGLSGHDVLVGIPAENAGRKDPVITNAEIGINNEFGSPAKHIPARPHLRPGVQNAGPQIAAALKKGIMQSLAGNAAGGEAALYAAGEIAVRYVRRKITEGPFVPLSPVTIQARADRGRRGAILAMKMIEAGEEPPYGMVKPLIDTGEYRRAMTYVVVKRGER